mgnify:CR=1 FL=1
MFAAFAGTRCESGVSPARITTTWGEDSRLRLRTVRAKTWRREALAADHRVAAQVREFHQPLRDLVVGVDPLAEAGLDAPPLDREALQLAETYGIGSVATHAVGLRATPPGSTPLATAPAEVMASTLWDALVDHARVARRVVRVQVYERDAARIPDLVRALQDATADE